MEFIDVYRELVEEIGPLDVYLTWDEGKIESVNVRDGNVITVIDREMMARVWL